jgi:Ca-activated chloride channel homolog
VSLGKAWLGVGLATCVVVAALVTVVIRYPQSSPASAPPPPPYTLRVLAGRELGDMAPILAQAAAATGVTVRLVQADSFTAAQDVMDGTARRRQDDAVWLASDEYFGLYPAAASGLAESAPIMSSPTVLAVRTSVARRLGWLNGSVTWKDIAEAAGAGQFKFGMASPDTADSGLSGLVAAATATAHAKGPLQESQILGTVPKLTDLFQHQVMSARDAAKLAQDYLKDLEHPASGPPDGIIDDEADLIALKAEAPPGDPLTLVYPSNGVIEADYPLSLLTSAPPAAQAAFQRLVRYLTSPAIQQQIMTTTHRRPAAHPGQPDGELPATLDVLPSPDKPATVKKLIQLYFGQLRAPGRTVYVLDTSESMGPDQGLTGLKNALSTLTGAGGTTAGEFSEFRDGEEVTLLPFSDKPAAPATYPIPASGPGGMLAGIRTYVNGLKPHGQTAMYDALVRAYQLLHDQDAAAPGRIDSIVVITDGKTYKGRQLAGPDGFAAYYNSLWAHSEPAPVYTIAVGQASTKDLEQVATLTGGTFTNAGSDPVSALDEIIEDIRGYQ